MFLLISRKNVSSFLPEDFGPDQVLAKRKKKHFLAKKSEGVKWGAETWESVQFRDQYHQIKKLGLSNRFLGSARIFAASPFCLDITLNIQFPKAKVD